MEINIICIRLYIQCKLDPGGIYRYKILNVSKNKNVHENSYDKLEILWEFTKQIQDETTTEKYLVTCTMLVDTAVIPGLSSYTG